MLRHEALIHVERDCFDAGDEQQIRELSSVIFQQLLIRSGR